MKHLLQVHALHASQLIERSLRAELAGPTRPPSGPPIPVFSGGTGPRAGIDLSSNRALAEVLDAGLPPGKLR